MNKGEVDLNKRWVICAEKKGVHPDDLRSVDFLAWMDPLIAEFKQNHRLVSEEDHDNFTAWLEER